jgi:hypothetical protein
MTNEPETKMFSTRQDVELLRAIKHLSVDLNKSVAELTKEALTDLLKKYRTQDAPEK